MSDFSSRLANKRVLITAAGAGIGHATVLRLAAEGAEVIATDVNQAALAAFAGVGGVASHRLDVTQSVAIAEIAAQVGPLDGLVNCVGIVPSGTVLDCSDETWRETLEVNVTSCFRMIRAFLPALLAQGGGAILNVASVVSSLKGAPNRFAYGASKAAVIGITKSVAADFVDRGIRCNAICPGTIDTPSLQARLRATGDYEQARAQFEARQPLGRLGTAEEIAALAAYLVSDDASFVTGQAYAVDGGWTL